MSFWGRAVFEKHCAEYALKLATLTAELNRSAFRASSKPVGYLIDIRDLDALECRERWPAGRGFSG